MKQPQAIAFDGLRLLHLFRTGSDPGGSVRFPMRWSTLDGAVPMFLGNKRQRGNDIITLNTDYLRDFDWVWVKWK